MATHWVFVGVEKVKEKLEAVNGRFFQYSFFDSFVMRRIAKDLGLMEGEAAAEARKWLGFAAGMIGSFGGTPVRTFPNRPRWPNSLTNNSFPCREVRLQVLQTF